MERPFYYYKEWNMNTIYSIKNEVTAHVTEKKKNKGHKGNTTANWH